MRAEETGGERMPKDLVTPLADAHLALFRDTFRDLLRIEAERVSRASKRDGWPAWRDDYYADRAAYVTGKLSSVFDAFARAVWAVVRSGDMPSAVEAVVLQQSREAAERHVGLSMADLGEVAMPDGVEQLSNEWVKLRAPFVGCEEMESLVTLMRQLCGVPVIREEKGNG